MAYQLVIVGGGRMGSALAEGLLDASWCTPDQMAIVEVSSDRRELLGKRLAEVAVVAALEPEHVDANTGALLCVKPDHAEGAARRAVEAGVTRLLSVGAGLSGAGRRHPLHAQYPGTGAQGRQRHRRWRARDQGRSRLGGDDS